MRNSKYKIVSRLWLIFCVMILVCQCDKSDRNDTVAKIGDRLLTVDEFQWAYELAPRSVTQLGNDTARTIVLQRLINQVLLAHEGMKKGYDKDSSFQKILNNYRDMAINRELYLSHIRDSVRISDTDFQWAYEKSKTTLFVQNFCAATKEEAEQIRTEELLVPHTTVNEFTETRLLDPYGPVDVIGWNVIEEKIEDLLYRLPRLEYSEPVYDGKVYHVFRVVEKEIEALNRESDFYAVKPTLESALRKRKEHQKSFKFVRETMAPQNVIIRAKTLNAVTDRFWDFYQQSEDRPPQELEFSEIQSLFADIDELLEMELASFADGSFSVSDYLFYYRLNPSSVNHTNWSSVRESIQNAVATYIRDIVFAQQGKNEGLDRKVSVFKETQQWCEKLLAAKVKKELLNDITSAVSDSCLYRKIYRDSLDSYLAGLNKQTDISINKQILSKIPVSDTGMGRKIDFFATYVK